MIGGLSERKMKNRRFRQTEEKIFDVYFGTKEDLRMKELARRVGISRATLYRHHRAISKILPDYELYIYKNFLKYVKGFDYEKNLNIRLFYYRMLSFMLSYKKEFMVLLSRGETKTIKKMIEITRDLVSLKYNLPKNSEIIVDIYNSEILSVIEEWGRRGFLEEDVDKTIVNIIYLSRTARTRLLPLVN